MSVSMCMQVRHNIINEGLRTRVVMGPTNRRSHETSQEILGCPDYWAILDMGPTNGRSHETSQEILSCPDYWAILDMGPTNGTSHETSQEILGCPDIKIMGLARMETLMRRPRLVCIVNLDMEPSKRGHHGRYPRLIEPTLGMGPEEIRHVCVSSQPFCWIVCLGKAV